LKSPAKILKNNLNGILGTVIFHLVLLIMFLSFRLHDTMNRQELIEVKLQAEDATDLLKKLDEAEQAKAELQKKIDQQAEGLIRRNIGVNVAEKTEEEINTEKFIQQFADEKHLTAFEKLENQDNPQQAQENKPEPSENTLAEEKKPVTPSRPIGSGQVYKGPTNIYFALEGRMVKYLPVPVYKCEGSGKVVVEIYVNPAGEVVSTSILKDQSSSDDDCLYSTATAYASQTLFSQVPSAPARQRGTLTYDFVAQH